MFVQYPSPTRQEKKNIIYGSFNVILVFNASSTEAGREKVIWDFSSVALIYFMTLKFIA